MVHKILITYYDFCYCMTSYSSFLLVYCKSSCYGIVRLLCIAQKYLSLMKKPEDQFTVVKVKGLQHVESKDMDANTFFQPISKSGTSEL